MIDWLSDFLFRVAILAPPILVALTVHEVSHGVVANFRGDPTAKLAGRLSLNPLKHLDLSGTLVFFVTAWFGSGIGWAKPVPVDYRNLKNPRRDGMFISAAGPAANLITAVILAVILNALVNIGLFRDVMADAGMPGYGGVWKKYLFYMFHMGVYINVILALFNLIPLPPLDGSGILTGLLPPQAAYKYQQISRYGFMILLGLIFLPGWIPGFPDIIGSFVVSPARMLAGMLLPI